MHVREYLVVVRPCRTGEEDWLIGGARVESRQEQSTEVDGTGARDGLKAGRLDVVSPIAEMRLGKLLHPLLFDRGAVSAQYDLLSSPGEIC